MKIPTTLQIANRTWTVRRKKLRKAYGTTNFGRATITLDSALTGELLDHTFLHELLHATSGAMGWSAVNDDEDRLDALAGLLVQAFNTSE